MWRDYQRRRDAVRAKSKKRKKARDHSNVSTVITLIVGAVLGSGALWSWKQYELQIITKRIEMAEKIQANIISILALYNKNAELLNETGKDPNGRLEKAEINMQISRIWDHEFPILEANLKTYEAILAKLENRNPRDFHLGTPPRTAPTNVQLTVIEK
jgi:hypothetical protein